MDEDKPHVAGPYRIQLDIPGFPTGVSAAFARSQDRDLYLLAAQLAHALWVGKRAEAKAALEGIRALQHRKQSLKTLMGWISLFTLYLGVERG